MKRLVREDIIDEKFTEESPDPIADMNIGGYTFKTLKSGAVITAVVPRLSLQKDNKGYFTYPGKGIDLPIDFPILVTGVRDFIIKGHKEIKIHKGDAKLEEVMKKREEFRISGKVSLWGTNSRIIINETKFNRIFKVIEKGF